MTLFRPKRSKAITKEDGTISPPASLSSASVNTLDGEESSSTQQLQQPAHPEEDPPSYDDVTSMHSSQHSHAPIVPSSNVAETHKSLNTAPGEGINVATQQAHVPTSIQTCPSQPSKVKVHEGNFTLYSSETITGPIVIAGDLQVHATLRCIGRLEVRKSLKNHGSTTVDGDFCIAGDVKNHGKLHVSETTSISGKMRNHGRVEFAKQVMHHESVTNHGRLTYNDSVDFSHVDIVNHGTINVENGARNVGKVRNHGKLNGMSSL